MDTELEEAQIEMSPYHQEYLRTQNRHPEILLTWFR
jgi:hypothetical protein